VLVLHLLTFIFIGLLPVVFFVRGSFGWRWWLTGAPFFVSAVLLAAALVGWVHSPVPSGSWRTALDVMSVVCAAGTIALIAFTLGTHRIPIALWHQTHDAPRQIVTWGAYGRIRHPFYTAFLLAFIGAALAVPHLGTLATLVYAVVVLTLTAAREERRLLGSDFAREYAAYMERTGRFVPRWRAGA
jgi:protein-S-isoprenylcysteine O-methyltransferase Ste14